MNIRDAKRNVVYKIVEIEGESNIVRRLNELGLYKGGAVVVRRRSILGESYVVLVQGSEIAIRYSALCGVVLNG